MRQGLTYREVRPTEGRDSAMSKNYQHPKQTQRRDNLTKVFKLAAALFDLARFVLIVLQILRLWKELAG